jgi:hypothetical protein
MGEGVGGWYLYEIALWLHTGPEDYSGMDLEID